MSRQFRALVLSDHDGVVRPTIATLTDDQLPPGDVLVQVAYSSLNYKDGMAVANVGRIVRTFPFVPGI
ncbi:MAG: oxidoreductase, partial [Dehalococcoidia bacterium]|nr:oxidoreductase [Dehalococcoidia bacterium]